VNKYNPLASCTQRLFEQLLSCPVEVWTYLLIGPKVCWFVLKSRLAMKKNTALTCFKNTARWDSNPLLKQRYDLN